MKRKSEFFSPTAGFSPVSRGRIPRHLYPQERDWSCAFACLRTMLSCFQEDVPGEDAMLAGREIRPGPLYSRDLKALGLPEGCEVHYGCDDPDPHLDRVVALLDQGYSVMLESMYNYAHWMVLLAYFTLGDGSSAEADRMLCYDPYYHEVRLLNADEFFAMWQDGDHGKTGIFRDYLALTLRKE